MLQNWLLILHRFPIMLWCIKITVYWISTILVAEHVKSKAKGISKSEVAETWSDTGLRREQKIKIGSYIFKRMFSILTYLITMKLALNLNFTSIKTHEILYKIKTLFAHLFNRLTMSLMAWGWHASEGDCIFDKTFIKVDSKCFSNHGKLIANFTSANVFM